MIWTVAFWKGLGERAIKSFIQGFVVAVGAAIAGKTTAWEIPWDTTLWSALGIGLLMAVASVVTSFGSAGFVAGESKVTADSDATAEALAALEEPSEDAPAAGEPLLDDRS